MNVIRSFGILMEAARIGVPVAFSTYSFVREMRDHVSQFRKLQANFQNPGGIEATNSFKYFIKTEAKRRLLEHLAT